MEYTHRVTAYICDERVTPESDYKGTHEDCIEWLEDFEDDYPEIDFVIVKNTTGAMNADRTT